MLFELVAPIVVGDDQCRSIQPHLLVRAWATLYLLISTLNQQKRCVVFSHTPFFS